MLDFQQIKAQYPTALQVFEKGILREYLQYKILQGIFESKLASRVAFMGGTALRIIYGNNRFSEDIDLENSGISWAEFEDMVEAVRRFLSLEGFEVELKKVEKAAYHCNIRFPHILFEHGISPLQQEKILIQVDTLAQGYDYEPDVRILNGFDVFTSVRVTPLPILLSQKIYAAVNRKRPKGRDFYDITFLLAQTKPDYAYLGQMLGIGTTEGIREIMLERIAGMDMEAVADDVAPFLVCEGDRKRVSLFKAFWEQADLE
jgi:predicted nucleotidyltransferase component of viral defense system